MAYHVHDATEGANYGSNDHESHSLFMEEEQKYASSNYNSKDDPFSMDYKTKEEDEEKRKEEMTDFEKQIEEGQGKKYENKELDSEAIKRKAAEEINKGMSQFDGKEIKKKEKNKSSIEEAIEKAVKEEKEVFTLDY